MPVKDPLGAILRGDPPISGLGTWMIGAYRDAYPEAFAATCARVNGFDRWPSAPWFVVREHLPAAEPDPTVLEDWRAAFAVAEAVTYPLENLLEAHQFVSRAVERLHGYASRVPAPGLAREARLLASAVAHAFATADDDAETIAPGVVAWRSRLAAADGA